MFHRFARYRTLKTRAKLLDKLRRRGRWDWDANQQPFFNPKHVRLASHINRPRWRPNEDKDGKAKETQEEALDEDGFELSRREKEWKDQMEAMRKRIEQDPYEAVFGKRFEPFWSPLVPTWMREEMGLEEERKPRYSRNGNSTPGYSPPKPPSSEAKPVNPVERASKQQSKNEAESDGETPNGQLTSYSYTPKKPTVGGEPESPNGQLTNYSYAASTSTTWDSWTKKTRRIEWDSISGKARRYEYDPISNRMVEISQPTGLEASKSAPLEAAKQDPMFGAEKKSKQPYVKANGFVESTAPEVADWTVKSAAEGRRSIPIPTQTVEPTPKAKTSVYFPSLLNTSVVPKARKPADVATVPEKEIDKLTANDVRASVGKLKEGRTTATQALSGQDEARAHRNGKMDPTKSQWDQAETQMMLNEHIDALTQKRDKLLQQEHQFFQDANLSQRLLSTNDRLLDAKKRLVEMDQTETKARGTVAQMVDYTREKTINRFWRERLQRHATMQLETALDRKTDTHTDISPQSMPQAKPTTAASLQPSVERMQSKDLPSAVELDDSAAHESTGDRVDYSAANVPKQWGKQADLLQADRIKRTRGTVSEHIPAIDGWTQHQTLHLDQLKQKHSADKPRWTDIMNARRAKYEAEKAEKKTVDPSAAARKEKLAKANAMLEAEVNEQKTRMQAHEGQLVPNVSTSASTSASDGSFRRTVDFEAERERYKAKIRDLRKELDTTFKQSSVNAEMHLDRIRDLANGGSRETAEFEVERERYKQKIRDLRKELDTTFKQSSVNAEMHVERIRDLEKEMEALRKSNIADVRFEEERFQQKINVLKADIDRAYIPYVERSQKQAVQIQELEKKLKEAESGSKPAKTGPEISHAEGDFCKNVTKYAKDNSKWYKKPCRNPEATGKPTEQEINAAAKSVKTQEDSLARQVKDIYESRYGTIDVNHRQLDDYTYRPGTTAPEPEVVEAASGAEVDRALSDYEKKKSYSYEKDTLAAEMAAQEKAAHDAQSLTEPESSSKMRQVIADNLGKDVHGSRIVDDNLPKLIPTEIAAQTASEAAAANEWGIEWEEPPVYKVLAYDAGNDVIKTAVTSSNFTNKETPISIQKALSGLYQPARFVAHFAELQKDGYQVIDGTKDLLVFKKVKSTAQATATESEDRASLQDHGLFKGTEEATANSAGRNPIDGMSHPIEPSTGSFASPTGFVGDRWFSEGQAQSPSTVSKAADSTLGSSKEQDAYDDHADGMEIKHYPRVKREERVYSGSRLTKRQRKQAQRDYAAFEKESTRRSKMRWALWTGLGASVVAYSVGAAAERKDAGREKERWEEILEGRRLR